MTGGAARKGRARNDQAPVSGGIPQSEMPFAPALYFMAGVFFLTPIVDAASNVWPFALGLETWRYGAFGAAANYLVSVLFGAVLAGWVAVRCQHRGTLRFVAFGSIFMAVILTVIAGEFALDVLQLQNVVPAPDRTGFAIGAAKSELKYASTIIGFVILAVVALRSSAALPRHRRSTAGSPGRLTPDAAAVASTPTNRPVQPS